ncbi:YncE family protein [Terriglobus saanensis]|uniref:40-residue YVTN family beta-propeller repeat protein n=1 Tax=Terriglobus saanensis (strain ATCC BAA-1853 / DSM 23119 / SP1PR4) TaxID=401053 RepID=E8UWY4_TERSS|nr:YncE family protein [Terriglobus saanensis]ADV81871.1 40-residue YVTN family beta-propeller repeat protein [Terriglobus saanensis SP1PR4]
MGRRIALFSLAMFSVLAAVQASAAQNYHIIDKWLIGGQGSWDYLLADSEAHLLYLTHGPRVEVVDTLTGKAVGAITGFKSTHGIALDPDGKTGYISDGQGNSVAVFDRKSFAVIKTVAAGTNPDGIAYEPTTKTVWAFNGRSNDATVIDAATKQVIATIKLPGKPEFPQVDGKGHVFVNIEDKNSIVLLDAGSKTATATWPLAGCESPSGMAIDREHHRLFSVCDGKKMAVTDALSGKQIALAPIGDGPDAAGYDSKRQLAFSSNSDATLTVIDAAHGYKAVETIATQKGARTMSYDEKSDRIYLVTAQTGPKPAATVENPRARPAIVPGTFTVLVVGRK